MLDRKAQVTDWEELKRRMESVSRRLASGEVTPASQRETLRARARAIAQDLLPPQPDAGFDQYFCFYVGETHFALAFPEPVSAFRIRDSYVLPGMPAITPGLFHFRGALIAGVDLRRLLQIDSGEPAVVTVAAVDGNTIGILADGIEGTRRLSPRDFCSVPAHLGEFHKRFVKAVTPDMTMLLDLHEICQFVRTLHAN